MKKFYYFHKISSKNINLIYTPTTKARGILEYERECLVLLSLGLTLCACVIVI